MFIDQERRGHVNSDLYVCVVWGRVAAEWNPSLLACGPDYWRDSESLIDL